LFASRKQIEDYIKKEKLRYRFDSSNDSTDYVRNFIRKEIIPKFKEINPSFEETMYQNMLNFNGAASIFNATIDNIKDRLVQKNDNQVIINISDLTPLDNLRTILFEILSEYNFSYDTICKLIDGLNNEPGKLFYSGTHKLLIDREQLIIENLQNDTVTYFINSINDFKDLPIEFDANLIDKSVFKLNKDNKIANLDADQIEFPLTLRTWEQGDFFYPLGMNSKKKLSDFFIDQKIDRFAKEKTWLLESKGKIVWVVGLRIDNRFKVTDSTKNILQIQLKH